jgi:hypothetical protein
MRIMLWQVKCYDWRGIHLINFVSNFYHERKKQVRAALTDDVLEFKQYCKMENEK